jgi:hypothetical protein
MLFRLKGRWAAATGQDTTIDDRVAGPLLAGAQASITDDFRHSGARAVFPQPVPVDPDSPAGERLVAFLGRSPQFR